MEQSQPASSVAGMGPVWLARISVLSCLQTSERFRSTAQVLPHSDWPLLKDFLVRPRRD